MPGELAARAGVPIEHLELGAIVGAAVAQNAVAYLGRDGSLGALDAGVGALLNARLQDGAARVLGMPRGPGEAERCRGNEQASPQASVPPCWPTSAMRAW